MAESNDRQLFILQKKLKAGDTQAMSDMYTQLRMIAYKTINSLCDSNPHVKALSSAERQQKAHDAATYIIEQYLTRKDFVIKKSITGYLYRRVQWELYGKGHQNKRDQMVVYMGDLPERNCTHIKYKYLVKNVKTGESTVYESVTALYLAPAFKGLRKKRLADSIKTGRRWKNYIFDILEVMG
jgi:hypothetical protein